MITADIIHNSFIVLFTTTLIIKVVLLLLNISNMQKHFQKVPEQFKGIINLEDHQKAQEYTTLKNKLNIFSIVFHGVVLLAWLKTDALNWLITYATSSTESAVWQGIIFLIAFSIINSIISLPESLFSTFYIEEKFGFNKMNPSLFVKDLAKQFLVSMIIGVPFIYVVLTILYSLGENWWFYTWVFIIAFQFIIIWAYPKFIAPLFNKFTELDDEGLTVKIKELSSKCEINFKDYFVMNASLRSSHGNAYFTGFGKNKRIVFFDTLLKSLSTEEVISVLAHELGHFKKKHIMKSIITSSFFLFVGLFILGQLYNHPALFAAFNVQSSESYVALLLFMLIIPYYTFILTPVSSWFSRKNEFEADEFAATYASAKELITALLKMYKDNSSTLTPHPVYSKFYFSHPPAKERIEFLNKFST